MPQQQTPVRPLNSAPVLAVNTGGEKDSDDDGIEEEAEEDLEGIIAALDEPELDEVLCQVCDPKDEEEEAQPHKTLRNPRQPTKTEREDHR